MAATQVETVNTGADIAKLGVAAALVVGALVGFFMLEKQGALVQWGVFLVGLALAIGAFMTSEAGKRLLAFGQDAIKEVKKVVWPSRKEAGTMTLYVFGFVAIMAAFLWLTDKTLEWVIFDLILGWRK